MENRIKLERLKEELIDNIINTPDEEILKEVEEDYGDSSFIANKVRSIFNRAIKQIESTKRK